MPCSSILVIMTHTSHASKQQRFDGAVILLDPPADAYSVGIGYINDLSTYEDGSNSKNGDDNDISNSDGGFEAGADYVLSRAQPPVQNATTAAGTQNNPKKKEEQQQRRKQLSTFVSLRQISALTKARLLQKSRTCCSELIQRRTCTSRTKSA